ncbi:Protein quaking-A [Anabarilius grahami]|uniref:Protein quaking-A n=1 Tax=Anabarilius grahami TaxID=495550 RepID=A0A3N0Y5U1_ANAGA|nr:Protein quaking-A [Anabarilius grahami]
MTRTPRKPLLKITRVRKDMYNDTVNGLVDKHPLELPEAVGPIVHLQEKLFVPVKEYPDAGIWLGHPICSLIEDKVSMIVDSEVLIFK